MKNKSYLCLASILLCIFLTVHALKAQGVENITPKKLTGSSSEEGAIITKSDAIFIGKITEIGPPLARSSGESTYPGVVVQVTQVLKGSFDSTETVLLRVKKQKELNEYPPEVGTSYVFFVKRDTTWNVVLKLLLATDANIAKVKTLIAATPAGK